MSTRIARAELRHELLGADPRDRAAVGGRASRRSHLARPTYAPISADDDHDSPAPQAIGEQNEPPSS